MFKIQTLQILVLLMASPLKGRSLEKDDSKLRLLAEEVVANYANATQKNVEFVKPISSKSQSEPCRFVKRGTEEASRLCGTPGGFKPVPSDDSRVQSAAEYAIFDLNRRSNCIYQYKLVSVDHAMLKVEDGNDYLMNITTCMSRPQDAGAENACKKLHPEIIQHCNVAVLVHPWEDQPDVMTDFKCTGCT